MKTHLTRLLFVLLAAGCATRDVPTLDTPPLQLAGNQVVIGERITFRGVDGNSLVAQPGVYRVGLRDTNELELFFGSAPTPKVLPAKKMKIELRPEQVGALTESRVVLRTSTSPGRRELWLCMPDGTVYGVAGTSVGVRLRGELLAQTQPLQLDAVFAPAKLLVNIATPTQNQVYWNRREPLKVSWSGGTGLFTVSLVQRVTLCALVSQVARNGNNVDFKSQQMRHLDPGLYDVVVQDVGTGTMDTRSVRVVGSVRSIAGPPNRPYSDRAVWALGPDSSHSTEHANYIYKVEQNSPPSGSIGVRAHALAIGQVPGLSGMHQLAISMDGGVLVWGANNLGQLGTGDRIDRSRPFALPAPLNSGVIQVAACGGRSYALKEDGSVYEWDGLGSATPTVVLTAPGEPLTDAVAISAGEWSGAALDASGQIWDLDYDYKVYGFLAAKERSYDTVGQVVHLELYADTRFLFGLAQNGAILTFASGSGRHIPGSWDLPSYHEWSVYDGYRQFNTPVSLGQLGYRMGNGGFYPGFLLDSKPLQCLTIDDANSFLRTYSHPLVAYADAAICWDGERLLLMNMIDYEPQYFPFR